MKLTDTAILGKNYINRWTRLYVKKYDFYWSIVLGQSIFLYLFRLPSQILFYLFCFLNIHRSNFLLYFASLEGLSSVLYDVSLRLHPWFFSRDCFIIVHIAFTLQLENSLEKLLCLPPALHWSGSSGCCPSPLITDETLLYCLTSRVGSFCKLFYINNNKTFAASAM